MTKTAFRVRRSGTGWGVVDGDGVSRADTLPTCDDAVMRAKALAKEAGGAAVIVFDEEDVVDRELYYMPSHSGEGPSYVSLHPMRMSRVSMPD